MKKIRRVLMPLLCTCFAFFCLSACAQTAASDPLTGSSAAVECVVPPAKAETASITTAETQEIAFSASSQSLAEVPEAVASASDFSAEPAPQESVIPAPSVCGKLSVVGTQLVDENGKSVQLRGLSTHGLSFFPQYVNEELFRAFHQDWNANVIRLAMYTAEYGGYCTGGDQEYLKDLVRSGVEYATSQDMYVIIDWHILSDGNPAQYQSEAIDFFAQMSKEFSKYDNVLYEICNEPNGGTSWQEIKSYAQEVIPAIRANAPDAVILVGTPNWSQYVNEAAADPITGYDNIMYTLHFYAATHTDALRNTMAAAIDAGLPIFVSEYGICDASGNGAIDEAQASAWVQLMDQYQVSYVAWNISNKNETSAIIKSTVDKSSGLSWEDLSDSGKWLYQMLTREQGELPTPATTDNCKIADSPAVEGEPNSNQDAAIRSGDFEILATLVNSWEFDGKHFYQYSLTIKNTASQPCQSWAVDVPFSGDIALSDSWNGQYSAEGDTLHISSMDYNGNLSSGGSTDNVGFIISGAADLKLQ